MLTGQPIGTPHAYCLSLQTNNCEYVTCSCLVDEPGVTGKRLPSVTSGELAGYLQPPARDYMSITASTL